MDGSGPVVALGGTGYLGTALTTSLLADGNPVRVLTRQAAATVPPGAERAQWDAAAGPAALGRTLAGARAVVNLAGGNIGAGRWTPGRREQLTRSRTETTALVVAALAGLPAGDRPPALVNASGIDYYGDRDDDVVTERDGPGDSFLAELCMRWEATAQRAEELGVRVVRLRTGFVLSRDSAALRKLVQPFRMFAGGPLGTGRQWVSWIHLADVVGLYRLAIDDGELSGALNLVAPEPRRETDFAWQIGQLLGRPSWLPAPAFALRLALGQQADLVLHGRRAAPEVAIAHGYEFRYATLEDALSDVVGR